MRRTVISSDSPSMSRRVLAGNTLDFPPTRAQRLRLASLAPWSVRRHARVLGGIMSARDDLIALLGGVSITVNIGGALVNPGRFRAVRAAVQDRSIHVIVNPRLESNTAIRNWLTNARVGAGFAAQYVSAPMNRFEFRQDAIPDVHARALAVHEAVHAALDRFHVSVWAVDDEAAAYTSQCIYLLSNGYSPPSPHPLPIFNAAFPVAAALLAYSRSTAAQLQALRQAIAARYIHVASPNARYTRDG
jgi:hypothetical protein